MNAIIKSGFKKGLSIAFAYLGKCLVDRAFKLFDEWWDKRHNRQESELADHIEQESEELAPSETLDNVITKSESNKEIELFPNLLHKGDTCLICASPNVGKSTLAMQMGLDIAAGRSSQLTVGSEKRTFAPQTVYYYDGEMRNSDMLNRFGKGTGTYPNAFLRVRGGELDSLEKLYNDMEQRVTKKHPNEDCTVILDNIACFCRNKSSNAVSKFLKSLNALKAKYEERGHKLTVLIVIHTSKKYAKYAPLELKDIAGAAEFGRFANSAIALMESGLGNNKRILKILKYKYGAIPQEVSIVNLVSEPYLHFEFECSMLEEEALPVKVKTGKAAHSKTKEKAVAMDAGVFFAGSIHSDMGSIRTDSTPKDGRRKVSLPILQRMKQLSESGAKQTIIANILNLSRKNVNIYLRDIKRGKYDLAMSCYPAVSSLGGTFPV